MSYNSVINEKIRRFMEVKKLSQADFAELLKIKQADISNRLNGRVRWSVRDIDFLVAAGVKLPAPSKTFIDSKGE